MALDPGALDLQALCPNPVVFDSRERWRAAGFDVIAREGDEEIMVAAHWSVPGYLFKKFTNKISAKDQLRNYKLRVEGSVELRKFIANRNLQRIAVPQKWVRDLPGGGGQLLLVERLDVLSRRETRAAYNLVDHATLGELCTVVHAFRGLDSGARNMLLMRDGRIAFVDTERWQDDSKKSYFKRIRDYLTSEQRVFADQMFKKLDGE